MYPGEQWRWFTAVVLCVLVLVSVRLFLYSPAVVDGDSMEPSLRNENRMLISHVGYVFNDPERFDIVVFTADDDRHYVKRVIGLPGDTIWYEGSSLIVNGTIVAEPFLSGSKPETQSGERFTVPADHVYVLGDNRLNSYDSRHIGSVPVAQISGKAELIFWPPESAGIVN
ncbi:signal peptidase I [Alkalicoccus luteus]|uniref:Signal peptidase I n=1 Tax=Alkalicoccus luteus TaxID=1237094 RepID=A0A969PP51_9BACI|nr:signal peptidase I [Alkalicoccus luteus]NJP36374.1 signal peptidase I [Alkalicoccus luteus]